MWFDNAKILYDACGRAWESICESACSRLLELVLEEVRPALQEYREHKRSTAQLDFDDLIYSACDLLRITRTFVKLSESAMRICSSTNSKTRIRCKPRSSGASAATHKKGHPPPKRTTHPEGTPTAPKRTPTGEAQKDTTGDNQAKNGTPTEAWPEFQIRPGAALPRWRPQAGHLQIPWCRCRSLSARKGRIARTRPRGLATHLHQLPFASRSSNTSISDLRSRSLKPMSSQDSRPSMPFVQHLTGGRVWHTCSAGKVRRGRHRPLGRCRARCRSGSRGRTLRSSHRQLCLPRC